ncbi:ABC transporter transmembrane domain-containing protein [Novosphingobium sp.]|uniref:ABC transporter transmembrane domain-containing protein n=1 Tax=Novosphingobium sp. TaxID=1874826 RepID=UPI003703DF75
MSSAPSGAAPEAPTETPALSEPKPARSLGPLGMVARETGKYPRQLLFALAALLTTSACTLAIPERIRIMIDKGFGAGSSITSINSSFQYLLMIAGILGIATAVRFYFVSWLGERVIADIREKVQANLLRLPPSFFEANSPSEISSRMTADTAIIEQVVGTSVSFALRNAITGIGGIVYLFFLAPAMLLRILIGIPLIIVPIVWLGRMVSKASRSSQDKIADVGSRTSEVLGAMRVVQAFNQEAREQSRFTAIVEQAFAAAKRRFGIRAIMTSIVIVEVMGGIVLLLWEGAIQVAEGKMSTGTIAGFVFASLIVAGAFGALTEIYGDLLRGAGAAGRLTELLNEQPAIAAPARPLTLPAHARGMLAFENVSFRYPTRLEHAALADFSLTIEPGETVAVVGPSGAGKSTLFQLAQRFYDPQAGTIKLDGVPLVSVDPAEIRRRMALVPQEGVLFAANARDNLRYGNWEASDEQIWEAARAANAEAFLRELPEGLDTFLGEGGARLSGGQRQRIAIARAVLREAPILLLDEATSALDAESERLVQDALEQLMKNRTTMVIAHRLATVRAADRIVVMDKGRMVETGTHKQLTKAGGLYARLASLQFDDKAFAAGGDS